MGEKNSKKAIVEKKYHTFKEFYPYYIQEHSNRTNRRLHVIGTLTSLITLLYLLFTGQFKLLFVPLLIGYGFAWVGHFFFEKNKPATFKYPVFSFRGDWKMLYEIVIARTRAF